MVEGVFSRVTSASAGDAVQGRPPAFYETSVKGRVRASAICPDLPSSPSGALPCFLHACESPSRSLLYHPLVRLGKHCPPRVSLPPKKRKGQPTKNTHLSAYVNVTSIKNY